MTEKPSYEELERRVQELEKIESEHKYFQEGLRENENLFKQLYEKAPLGYQSLDENGHFIVVNQTWLDTLGYTREEVIGKPFADFLHPDWRDHFKENFPRFKSIGEVLGVEFEMVKKNGNLILVSFTGKISRDKKGDFQKTHCIFHDITDRKRAEQALQESEEKYRTLFEHTGEALFVAQDGRIVFQNPRSTELTGYSAEELQSRVFIEFIYEDDREMVMDRHLRRIKGENPPKRYAFRIIHRSGSILWVELNAVMIQWNGKLATLNFMSDISERKQAEYALIESESLFRGMFKDHSAVMLLIDPDTGRIIKANQAAAQYYGYPLEKMIEMKIQQLNILSPAEVTEQMRWALNQQVNTFEFQHLLADGQVRDVEVHSAPITIQHQTLLFSIIRDITERKKAEEALNESSLFLANMSDIAYRADDKGNLVWVNSAAERITGHSRDDLIGKPFLPLFLEADHPSLIDVYKRTLMGESLECMLTFTSGVACHFTSLPRRKENGDIIGTFGVARDITRQLHAQRALHASEARLKKAQETAKIGNWEYDITTGKVWGSEEAFRIYGIERTCEFLSLDEIESYILDAKKVNQALVDLIAKKGVYDIEFQINSKAREGLTFIHSMADLVCDSDGNPLKVHGVIQDITDYRRMEEERRQSEKDLRESQRIAHLGSWRLDIATNQVVWTEELYKMYGLDPTLPPPAFTDHMKLFTPESWERLSASLEKTIETGIPYELELETVRKDGNNRWMWVRGETVNDSAGNTIGLWGAAQDITVRKLAEKEKLALEGQLRQAHKMEAVGRLAGGVAHDFNNMLSVIIGHAEMALEQMEPAQSLYSDLEQIKNAGERSADLTRQLLAFARKQTVAPKVIDLNKTVAGVTQMLQRLIGEDIHLAWIPGKNVWPVKVDPSQIDQVLANLCVNARDAIADVGKVTIETGNTVLDQTFCTEHTGFAPGEYVLLAVSDNGCGMDAETLVNVFEPFFTTKESGKGTGLGLATVYGAVKQNNGYVNVYSQPGQGTTFKIYLPRYLTKAAHLPDKVPGQPAEPGHETILLVEDEVVILRMTTIMLERLGYTVVSASTPGEAIRLANEYSGKIHLLMTDVVMPEMNGRDLAKNLLAFHPNLKRLFMSGYTANVIAHHGVLDEGVNFIQKPFSKKNLSAKVREVLDADKN